MAIGSNGRYRMMVDADFHFDRDEILIRLVRKTENGYVPITVRWEEGEEIPFNTALALHENEVGQPIAFPMPREMAELWLRCLSSYLLGVDGDLVRSNQELKTQLDRVTRQLESLIAGIGRLGSGTDNGLSKQTRV